MFAPSHDHRDLRIFSRSFDPVRGMIGYGTPTRQKGVRVPHKDQVVPHRAYDATRLLRDVGQRHSGGRPRRKHNLRDWMGATLLDRSGPPQGLVRSSGLNDLHLSGG